MTDFRHAQLDWDEQGQPRSRQFDDIYFSRDDGLGETRHVYIEGNALAERCATLPAGGSLVMTIAALLAATASPQNHAAMIVALFLLGVGWNANFVAGSALVTEHVARRPKKRP